VDGGALQGVDRGGFVCRGLLWWVFVPPGVEQLVDVVVQRRRDSGALPGEQRADSAGGGAERGGDPLGGVAHGDK